MSTLDGLREYRSGILLTAVCLLWLTGGSVSAEEAGGTASSDDASSSSTGLDSALKQEWGTYKMQWGANQYRGKEETKEAAASEEETENADAADEATELTREAPKSLRSGTSEESETPSGASLRSLEGQLPIAATKQAAEPAQ